MNPYIFLLFIFFIGVGNIRAVSFEEATEMLQGGNSHGAALAYEELIAQGKKNSAIYAYLGRAYEEQGKIAPASLNYQRALMLNPRQTEVRQVLQAMYERAGVPTFVPQWTQKVNEKISPIFLLSMGEIFFWGSAFFLVSQIFRNLRRNVSLIFGFSLCGLGAFLLGVGAWSDPRLAHAQLAVIHTEQGEPARSQPIGTSTGVAVLPPGSPVIVLSERADWDYCSLPNGANAWISSSSLSFVNPDHIPEGL